MEPQLRANDQHGLEFEGNLPRGDYDFFLRRTKFPDVPIDYKDQNGTFISIPNLTNYKNLFLMVNR